MDWFSITYIAFIAVVVIGLLVMTGRNWYMIMGPGKIEHENAFAKDMQKFAERLKGGKS